MPRRKSRLNKRSEMPDFVDVVLSKEEKQKCVSWMSENSNMIETFMLEYVGANVRVGYSFDKKNDAFICSFTPRDDEDVNNGKCLVSRADEPFTAFLVNVYKDKVILDGDEWQTLDDEYDFS